jgi:Na+-transporting NADH:ubiquinone oxidoreductase subunit C
MERSSTYIVGFAAVVCLVCGVLVSGAAVSLKSKQVENAALDKQKKVLIVGGLLENETTASPEEIQALFKENITAKIIDLKTGKIDSKIDMAKFDQAKYTKDPNTSTKAPARNGTGAKRIPNQVLVYERRKNGKLDRVILPVRGQGLWGPLYGYFALGADTNTIKGIIFYKHQETPGLGGEIENPSWMNQWPGQLVYNVKKDGTFGAVKIRVVKGPAKEGDKYGIDGLSGATITSRGVTNMLKFWLSKNGFDPYLARIRAGGGK